MKDPTNDLKDVQESVSALQRLITSLVLKYQAYANTKTKQELLYQQSLLAVGKDASPLDLANDDLGCAESVSTLISKVVKFPIITGTWTLLYRLKSDPRFQSVDENAGRGTIIICATGTGNGKIRGHVGILGDGKLIFSADSNDSLWKQNYTIETWNKRWRNFGGFRVHYFKLL